MIAELAGQLMDFCFFERSGVFVDPVEFFLVEGIALIGSLDHVIDSEPSRHGSIPTGLFFGSHACEDIGLGSE